MARLAAAEFLQLVHAPHLTPLCSSVLVILQSTAADVRHVLPPNFPFSSAHLFSLPLCFCHPSFLSTEALTIFRSYTLRHGLSTLLRWTACLPTIIAKAASSTDGAEAAVMPSNSLEESMPADDRLNAWNPYTAAVCLLLQRLIAGQDGLPLKLSEGQGDQAESGDGGGGEGEDASQGGRGYMDVAAYNNGVVEAVVAALLGAFLPREDEGWMEQHVDDLFR